MKKKLILFSFFFLPCLMAGLNVQVDAEAAILMNAETGAILFQKNVAEPMYPASLTKVATAYFILEKFPHALDDIVSVVEDHVKAVPPLQRQQAGSIHPSYRLEQRGTFIGLKAGDRISVRDLLFGLMLNSGNDAGNALASHIGGTIPAFMDALNQFLKEKQIHRTQLRNPHGLFDEEHVTTAYDIAKLTQHALQNPHFREIVKTTKAPKPAGLPGQEPFFISTNRLLKKGQFYYPKAIGVKTGYVAKAGFNLVAAAEDKGRLLIAVLLKCQDSDSRFRDAIKLFESAFKESKVERTLMAKGRDVFKREIPHAKKALQAVLYEDLKLSYYPAEEPAMKASLVWKEVRLPILKGTEVGEMLIKAETGEVLTSSKVYALEDVEKTLFASLITGMQILKTTVVQHYWIALFMTTLASLLGFLFYKKGTKVRE